MSVLFHHDNYDYYWDLYVHGLGFLKLGNFGYVIAHLPGCFCPWTFFYNIEKGTFTSKIFFILMLYTDSGGGFIIQHSTQRSCRECVSNKC